MPHDEKLPTSIPRRPSSPQPPTRMRRSARPWIALAALLFLFGLWQWNDSPSRWNMLERMRNGGKGGTTSEKKVPFEAHIMSKCPDAQYCLQKMVLPAMQRVHDKVDFTLSFIGTPTENDGVNCKHGPKECMGNILELCAFELYPDPKISLGFTMCITSDYRSIPDRDLIEECALEHAIDFKALNDCATEDNGAHGVGMLRESVKRSFQAGVTKSCTVRVDEKVYCIRDGGEWKECPNGPEVDTLVESIESLYQKQMMP